MADDFALLKQSGLVEAGVAQELGGRGTEVASLRRSERDG